MTAIGVLRAAYMGGLRVPQDLSVIGLDDIDFAEFTFPPLTTIRLSRADLARAAFDALRAQTDGKPQNPARIPGFHQPGHPRVDGAPPRTCPQQLQFSIFATFSKGGPLRRNDAEASRCRPRSCARIAATSSCVASAADSTIGIRPRLAKRDFGREPLRAESLPQVGQEKRCRQTSRDRAPACRLRVT